MNTRTAALLCCPVLLGLIAGCDRDAPKATTPAVPTPSAVVAATVAAAASSAVPAPSANLPSAPSASAGAAGVAENASPLVAARPFKTGVPHSLDAATPAPLFLFLHGYGASASVFEKALGVAAVAESRRFLYAIPDGTPDSAGRRFWNASDACCDFEHAAVDDVAYLRAVIADVSAKHRVDPKRVFVMGFSNGGFMAHRLACDAADQIAGIASMAGAAWKDPGKCKPSAHVTVLQLHGDADPAVRYEGGHVLDKGQMQPHPSAHDSVAGWAKLDGCNPALRSGRTIDLAPACAPKGSLPCV